MDTRVVDGLDAASTAGALVAAESERAGPWAAADGADADADTGDAPDAALLLTPTMATMPTSVKKANNR